MFLRGLKRGDGVRDVVSVVRGCPELMGASVKDDLVPMVGQLRRLDIEGEALTRLCLSHPEVLLKGNPENVQSIFDTLMALGIHRKYVTRIIHRCPSILAMSLEQLQDNLNFLSDRLSEEDLLLSIVRDPILLKEAKLNFQRVEAVLEKIGINHEESLTCIKKAPKLLTKDTQIMSDIIDWFLQCGLSSSQTKSMVCTYPQQLLKQLSIMKLKSQFLVSVAHRPFEDICTFPYYFNHAIVRTIGPRFTFLKERQHPALQSATLDALMRSNDEDFAQKIAGVDAAEYFVYRAQWIQMYGHRFSFRGRPKQS